MFTNVFRSIRLNKWPRCLLMSWRDAVIDPGLDPGHGQGRLRPGKGTGGLPGLRAHLPGTGHVDIMTDQGRGLRGTEGSFAPGLGPLLD